MPSPGRAQPRPPRPVWSASLMGRAGARLRTVLVVLVLVRGTSVPYEYYTVLYEYGTVRYSYRCLVLMDVLYRYRIRQSVSHYCLIYLSLPLPCLCLCLISASASVSSYLPLFLSLSHICLSPSYLYNFFHCCSCSTQQPGSIRTGKYPSLNSLHIACPHALQPASIFVSNQHAVTMLPDVTAYGIALHMIENIYNICMDRAPYADEGSCYVQHCIIERPADVKAPMAAGIRMDDLLAALYIYLMAPVSA